MDKIPDDLSNYPELEALQALAWEGPPEEVATNFKNQGNEHFKLGTPKGLVDAVKFYSQGLEEELPDGELKVSLHNNRAQAQLLLKNYGYAIKDSQEVLRMQPGNLKAYYRIAKASALLFKREEALEAIRAFREHGGLPKDISELEKLVPPEAPKAEDKYAEVRRKGIKVTEDDAYDCPRDIKIIFDDAGFLKISVLLLYDQFEQSDFIEEMREDQTLATQLAEMLPGPWDTDGKLLLENARAYYELSGRFYEVSLESPLIDILKSKRYAMPKLPTFHIVTPDFQFS
eukprot:CAMPEP_0204904492 /NCGR_PEP_ID=MMETSP1397-20131031/4893_1 /ASSEMBLY_ACC=CAM_ASM_000891 /TAXON_ID=49980 /ORGANISM="Climacostomum Climacostomum virens, Strain Stock W-24" /LENGTH=286 /DNA_ID=CAMNT_0052073287 /DNA_START=1 /DNA_END=861 /DNA_ORIENTATION=-